MVTCYMCTAAVKPGQGARVVVVVEQTHGQRGSTGFGFTGWGLPGLSRGGRIEKQLICRQCHDSYVPPGRAAHPLLWFFFWPVLLFSPAGRPVRAWLSGSPRLLGKGLVFIGVLGGAGAFLPSPDGGDAPTLDALFVAAVVIGFGLWLQRRPRQQVSLSDADILRAAQRLRGHITLSQAVIELGAPVADVRERLDALATQGVCALEVSEEGVVSYRFPELSAPTQSP